MPVIGAPYAKQEYWETGKYTGGTPNLKDGYSYQAQEGYSQIGTKKMAGFRGLVDVPVYGRTPTPAAPAPVPVAAAPAPAPAEVKPKAEAPAFDIRKYMQTQPATPAAADRPAADINPTLFNSVGQWDQSRFGRKAADGSTDNSPELFNQTRDWDFRGDRERNTDSSSTRSDGSAGPANGYARFLNEDNGASQAYRSAPGGAKRQDEADGASVSTGSSNQASQFWTPDAASRQRRQRMSGSKEFLSALGSYSQAS